MDDLIVQPAEAGHASQMADLFCADLRPEIAPMSIYGCRGVATYLRMQVGPCTYKRESMYFAATSGDRVVAALELRNISGELFLNYIAVVREYQGKGIGTRLLKSAIRMSGVENGEISLDVFEDNVRALNWYRRMGLRTAQTAAYLEVAAPPIREQEPAYVSELAQADLCQECFGFSRFNVVTAGKTYAVGRMGDHWFRLIDPGASAAPSVFQALHGLDAKRRFFAIAAAASIPESRIIRVLATVKRMSADTSQILASCKVNS